MTVKSQLSKLIGQKFLGRYDYFFKPELREIWGGAFNGQLFRRKIFKELCLHNQFIQIVETGAFRGNTTDYMAQQDIPVISVEFDLRLYGYVATRFALNRRVKVVQNDSRKFLKELVNDPTVAKRNVFFYLDAHWHDDLPLAEELELVFGHWSNSIVMIDDFQVPNTGYEYDDYGEGKELTLDYINQVPGSENYRRYFPSVDETHETGAKRGCIVICNDPKVSQVLDECQTLQKY